MDFRELRKRSENHRCFDCDFAEEMILAIEQRGAEVAKLRAALEPFTKLGGPNDGIMPAYHDIPDDIVVYENSGEAITAGDVRAARNAFGILHAPWKIPESDVDLPTAEDVRGIIDP